jgi:omega-amidase
MVLPELWTTGYCLDRIHEMAETVEGPSIQMLRVFAAEHKVEILAGSIAEMRDGRVYNSTFAINAGGEVIGHYSKIHLIGLMQEDTYIACGDKRCEVEFSFGKAGSIICYDLRFTELPRSLALSGCQTMFVPAEWPASRGRHWTILNIARAIENQMFVIAVNRVGSDANNTFFGHSMVVNPWGEVLAEGSETMEEVLIVDVDFASVAEIRSRIPVFKDRRPTLYELH